jgi:hypothetical protein
MLGVTYSKLQEKCFTLFCFYIYTFANDYFMSTQHQNNLYVLTMSKVEFNTTFRLNYVTKL